VQGNAGILSSNVKKKQVQLPDVTGLTVAVESPAKGQSHQPYGDSQEVWGRGGTWSVSFLFLCPPTQKVSARLQLAMNLLQKKIAHLDAGNHTSRKRMKELERELDVCLPLPLPRDTSVCRGPTPSRPPLTVAFPSPVRGQSVAAAALLTCCNLPRHMLYATK
jgi:hypothetical protein